MMDFVVVVDEMELSEKKLDRRRFLKRSLIFRFESGGDELK